MDTVIYIGNEKMQMVCGAKKGGSLIIDTFAQIDLPEGAVLNGVITSEELFVMAFRQLMTEHPDMLDRRVRLLIGGDQILTRVSIAPRISERQMLEWVKGEFSESEIREEMLYDYRIIKSDQQGDLALICAAQKEMIGSYIGIFEELGVELESIGAGLDSQIKLLNFLPETSEESFIFLTLDGSSLYASIYIDGVFRISNWTRLFSERSTPAVSGEIERMVSNLMQFSHTEGYAQDIKKIYVCGCRRDEIFLFKNITERFSLPTDLLRDKTGLIDAGDQRIRVDEYVYAIGTLL